MSRDAENGGALMLGLSAVAGATFAAIAYTMADKKWERDRRSRLYQDAKLL